MRPSGRKSPSRFAEFCRTRVCSAVRPRSLGRSAASRDAARRASHRGNRRSSADRGAARIRPGFQDRQGCRRRSGHSGSASRADGRLSSPRCASFSRGAISGRRCSTPPARSCSNCRLESVKRTAHMTVNFYTPGERPPWPPRPSPIRASPPTFWVRGSRARRLLGGMVRALPNDRAGARGDRRTSLATRSPSPSSTSMRIRTRQAATASAGSRRCCYSRAASRLRRRSARLREARSSSGWRAIWTRSQGSGLGSLRGLGSLEPPRIRPEFVMPREIVLRLEPPTLLPQKM